MRNLSNQEGGFFEGFFFHSFLTSFSQPQDISLHYASKPRCPFHGKERKTPHTCTLIFPNEYEKKSKIDDKGTPHIKYKYVEAFL